MNANQRRFKVFAREYMTCRDPMDEKGVVCKGDGTVEVRSSYFYRHGRSAEGHAAKVAEQMKMDEAPKGWTVVSSRDEYHSWPKKLSYFVAVLRFDGVTV